MWLFFWVNGFECGRKCDDNRPHHFKSGAFPHIGRKTCASCFPSRMTSWFFSRSLRRRTDDQCYDAVFGRHAYRTSKQPSTVSLPFESTLTRSFMTLLRFIGVLHCLNKVVVLFSALLRMNSVKLPRRVSVVPAGDPELGLRHVGRSFRFHHAGFEGWKTA